jgi:hypothetical protein
MFDSTSWTRYLTFWKKPGVKAVNSSHVFSFLTVSFSSWAPGSFFCLKFTPFLKKSSNRIAKDLPPSFDSFTKWSSDKFLSFHWLNLINLIYLALYNPYLAEIISPLQKALLFKILVKCIIEICDNLIQS